MVGGVVGVVAVGVIDGAAAGDGEYGAVAAVLTGDVLVAGAGVADVAVGLGAGVGGHGDGLCGGEFDAAVG